MTKYTATFKDGHQVAKTDKEVKNSLDFYNKICKSGMAKEHGGLEKIDARPYGKR